MKENEIKLIRDLYNHYDQNQEINDEFLKSLAENYGTIRGILMNVILKYDSDAEINDQYLDAKLKQYNIDLKSTILENDKNESKEDDAVSSEIIGETQEKQPPVASSSKETKRRWLIPVGVISIFIISGAVFFFLTSKNSITQENSLHRIENEYTEDYGTDNLNTTKKQGIVITDKAYFYLTPNLTSNKKAYIIKDDIFSYTNSINGFVEASFTNTKGVTTKGWILESAFLNYEFTITNTSNKEQKNQLFKELGTSYYKIKINNNIKNLNIRNYPIDGNIIGKISGGEIYTVTKVFEAIEPIYLLKYEMSFKDIETGVEIQKPADFKLSNLRMINDDLYYAEILNTDNTVNKIRLARNSFKVEYNDWFYLKELNGWMYSEFCEKLN